MSYKIEVDNLEDHVFHNMIINLPPNNKDWPEFYDNCCQLRVSTKNSHSAIVGFFIFCQYLHIGAGILSFGGDVFRL